MYFTYFTCTTKLRFSSWSCGGVLRVLKLYYKVAIFQLELQKCTSRITRVLQSCDFPAGAAEMYFTYWACTEKLRFRAGAVYYKVAIFELVLRKCTSRTARVLPVEPAKPVGGSFNI